TDNSRVPSTSRLRGAFGLVNNSGQSATQPSNKPPCFRYSMKNGNCPSGVTGAVGSHSIWTRPAKVLAIADHSSTSGCSPTGGAIHSLRSVPIAAQSADSATQCNPQLPDLGLCPLRPLREAVARPYWAQEAVIRSPPQCRLVLEAGGPHPTGGPPPPGSPRKCP